METMTWISLMVLGPGCLIVVWWFFRDITRTLAALDQARKRSSRHS